MSCWALNMRRTFRLHCTNLRRTPPNMARCRIQTERSEFSGQLQANGKDNRLKFKWQERGGPHVVAPPRHGSGTSLAQGNIPKCAGTKRYSTNSANGCTRRSFQSPCREEAMVDSFVFQIHWPKVLMVIGLMASLMLVLLYGQRNRD
jgi:hypothetical protein